MKPFGKVDTSHPMYQPRLKKTRLSAYERRATELALRETAIIQNGGTVPNPNGSQGQKEAWMRQRQAQLEHEREKLRMRHPPKEIQQRWIDEGEK